MIWLSLFTVYAEPIPPNVTAVAPVNPEPVMTTLVPPANGPLEGLTPLTARAAPV